MVQLNDLNGLLQPKGSTTPYETELREMEVFPLLPTDTRADVPTGDPRPPHVCARVTRTLVENRKAASTTQGMRGSCAAPVYY